MTDAATLFATCLDSRNQLMSKYDDAAENIAELSDFNASVLFNVDARKLDSNKQLRGHQFSAVIWNFPHVGRYVEIFDGTESIPC